MQIDTNKLEELIKEFTEGMVLCPEICQSSAFIGSFNGFPIRLQVMTLEDAEDEHDYDFNTAFNPIIKD